MRLQMKATDALEESVMANDHDFHHRALLDPLLICQVDSERNIPRDQFNIIRVEPRNGVAN